MICIIAGNYMEAQRFASAQEWEPNEWFFPMDELDLQRKSNFHVIVTGTAGLNIPPTYFDKIYNLAKKRGRIGRI